MGYNDDAPGAPPAKYFQGQHVWLREFDNGAPVDPIQPREFATVNPQGMHDYAVAEGWERMYSGSVRPHDKHDDGEREFSEDQIEGPAVYMTDVQCPKHGPDIGFGRAAHNLEEALTLAKELIRYFELLTPYLKTDVKSLGACLDMNAVLQEAGLEPLTWKEFLAVRHLEGSDVCVDLDGQTWGLNETEDGWEPYP